MINTILQSIKTARGSKAKLAILKKHMNNVLLRDTFEMAYNTRITYGLKKIPVVTEYMGEIGLDVAFNTLRKQFATRELTGNTAVDALRKLLSMLSESDATVLASVIKRDLEVGASGSSANKIWKGLIPEQPCMTASSYSEKAIAKIKFPAYAQLKADGVRCMLVAEKGEVTAWSRNGKTYVGIKPILDAVLKYHTESGIDFVIDGELVYKPKKTESFMDSLLGDSPETKDVEERTTGNGIIAKAQDGGTITPEEAECIHFQCWDSIDVDSYWGRNANAVTYKDRLLTAEYLLHQINDSHLELIETTVVNSLDEARKVYRRYVDMGLEGIILKNINGFWEFKRSANQVKFKEVIDIDLIVVGWYEHEKDPEMIGGVVVRSKCGLIQNNCGSGFTCKVQEEIDDGVFVDIPLKDLPDMNRKKLYHMRETLESGEVVLEMQCNGALKRKNQKPGEAPYRLFLGVAKQIRFDKGPEQANTYEEIFG
ncbi:MAG: DNA ligase [Bacilli bacterium]